MAVVPLLEASLILGNGIGWKREVLIVPKVVLLYYYWCSWMVCSLAKPTSDTYKKFKRKR